MRRLLRCRTLRIAAAIISFTTTGIIATATPALASASSYECNTYGNMYCVDVPAPFGNGKPVVLGSSSGGRLVRGQDMGWTCCNNHEVYRIHFVADTSQCIGVAAVTFRLTVRDCSGGDNSQVNWAWVPGSSVDGKWESTTSTLYMASDNTKGHQLFVGLPPSNGTYFTWTLIVINCCRAHSFRQ